MYESEIKNILFNSTKLNINSSKTQIFDLTKENRERKISQNYILTYLGYKFKISYTKKGEKNEATISKDKLQVLMSDDKLQRFKDKIDTSFAEYNALLIKYATEKNATETNSIINNGKVLNQIEKYVGKKEICKYYNYDEKAIKKIFISRFKGNKCREFKEYINICNSELTKNYSHDNIQRSITEFRKKLIL